MRSNQIWTDNHLIDTLKWLNEYDMAHSIDLFLSSNSFSGSLVHWTMMLRDVWKIGSFLHKFKHYNTETAAALFLLLFINRAAFWHDSNHKQQNQIMKQ